MKKNAIMITVVVPMNPMCSEIAANLKSLSFTGTLVRMPVWLPVSPPDIIAAWDCLRLYSDLGSDPWNTSDSILFFW